MSAAPDAAGRLIQRGDAAETARRIRMESILSGLQAVDADALDPLRRTTINSLVFTLDSALAPGRVVDYGAVLSEYGVWYLPYLINHNSGPLIAIPSLLEAQHTINSAADADAYVNRLQAIAPTLDGALEKMRADVAAGVMPPDFIIDKTIAVIDAFTGSAPEDNVLYESFRAKLERATIGKSDRWLTPARTAVADQVFPAYRRIGDYLREIRPGAVHDAGVWRLPEGDALYRAMILQMTDTTLTPQEIHQIGLDEVARIGAEMDAILKKEGYTEGGVGARMIALGEEARFRYPNTAEGKAKILADIAVQLEAVNAVAPQWFGTLPRYDVEVRAVPAFSEATASGGYYDAPALDGSRPGIYWINLYDTAVWPTYTVPTLTYHEAFPGHHFQGAIALAQDTPLVSKMLYSNASGEGWGLYAEKLAAEMGLYANDPYGDLGRLGDEMHRAVRLVVDTGMHAMKWSREDAIQYMTENEGNDPGEVKSEIDRYVVWPGQALGYKIGMLKIQELRRDAEAELGDRFDIKAFHDAILAVSSTALPVMDESMWAWIAAEKAGAP